MRQGNLEKLIGVLEGLLEVNRKLLSVYAGKRRMLAAMDLDGLQALMQSEQRLTARVMSLEESRKNLVIGLLQPEFRPRRLGKDVLLRQVIEQTSDPARSMLAMLRRQLLAVLQSQREASTSSQLASRRSLKHFRDMLELHHAGAVAAGHHTLAHRGQREMLPSRLG